MIYKSEDKIIVEYSKNTFYEVLRLLPGELFDEAFSITEGNFKRINELRIRNGHVCSYKLFDIKEIIHGKYICDNYLLNECINKFMNYSYYAYEEELRNGYITMFGGHRAGICGHTVVENGRITTISNFSSVNIRQAREYKGISRQFISRYYNDNLCDLLIVSPPGCGKTTFLRDMVRTLSLMNFNIGVCDERSEIAGMFQGKASFDLGPNTDVLDSCPKAEGMKMILRSMAPDIIVTDEIGKSEDLLAIKDALVSGTRVIATAHGDSIEKIRQGPIKDVIESKLFNLIVFLDKHPYPCTIKSVLKLK